MSVDREIASRHLLAANGLRTELPSEPRFVRIVVSAAWANSHAGQLLTCCLVNLLCRQVRLVGQIEIVSPTVPALIRQPNGDAAGSFPECLRDLAFWAVRAAIVTGPACTPENADHTLLIGQSDSELMMESAHTLLCVADGWRAWVGDPSSGYRFAAPKSNNPLGPFFAAALAAGEIFKRAWGIVRGRFLTHDGYSLWSGRTASDWDLLEDGPALMNLKLPPIHVIGAGAVGNSLTYILSNLDLASGYLIAIDDDKYDKTNLNRCLLAGLSDLGKPKVYAVAKAFRAAGVEAFPFEGTIKAYIKAQRSGLRCDVAREVDDGAFDIVVSCVDKGVSRQDVQGLHPRLLFGGSTFNLQAKTNFYTRRRGTACLACFNARERDGERLHALEAELRIMERDERSAFLGRHGLNVHAVEEYLAGAPCGHLGRAALNDFATRPPEEFSVGFVSLGAGLLLAAALLRSTVLAPSELGLAEMTTLNFLNGGLLDAALGSDPVCELNCQSLFTEELC